MATPAAAQTPAPTAAPSPDPTTAPTPDPAPAKDRSGFADAAGRAFAAMLAQLDPSATSLLSSQCEASEPSIGVLCTLALPAASDPAITLFAASSMGRTVAAMTMGVGMSDGSVMVEDGGTRAGERSVRYWNPGANGCTAVAAANDGTLVISVARRQPIGADCTGDAVFEPLEVAARLGLQQLAPFRSLGLPVDDLAGRNKVVSLITKGKLKIVERDIVKLPAEYAQLSDSGEVVARRDGKQWTIVFFDVRGVVDNYSAWVYRSSGKLTKEQDPLGSQIYELKRINEHWFHIKSN